MTFTLVDDACGGRVLAFDGYVYAPADFPLLTQSIAERGAAVERVAFAYHEAWADHDLDAIAALLADEASVTAPGRDALTTDEFLSEAGQLVGDPTVGRAGPSIYVGVDQALVAYEAWGIAGGTRDDPAARVDVLTTSDGAIARIEPLDRIDAVAHPDEWAAGIVDAYRRAWSSGDADAVRRLYGPDAVRSEPLYFVDYTGQDAIADLATRWFDRHPDTVLTVVEPFVFGDGDERQTVAALFTLTDSSGCEIPVATRLDVDGTGAITGERVFYDLRAIQSCGWRR